MRLLGHHSRIETAPAAVETSGFGVDAVEVMPRQRTGRLRHRAAVVLVVLVAVAGVVVTLVVTGLVGGNSPTGASADNATATSVTTVAQRSLSSQTNLSATLGYAGAYTVSAATAGTVTWLPNVGDIVQPGQQLYEVDGDPVALLTGATPAFRTLAEGETGADVAELNAELVALGYANAQQLSPSSAVFSAATATAVKRLQAHLGATQTGVLDPSRVLFLPTAARITALHASVGAVVASGAQVLDATSTTRQVVVALDASQQSEIKTGDHVVITLPDNSTTPGVVTAVGTVASAAAGSGGNGGNSTPTIEVDITPTDPSATGTFDQAPVQVAITTASVPTALVVPVAALIAPAGGGYALEVIGPNGTHRFEAVQLGIFDDADGLVQVSGPAVQAGQRVVVPAS